MRRNILFLVLISFLFTVQNATAADSKVVHTLKPGQTLSADVLNEILEALAYTDKIPTRDDFLGTWTCRRNTFDLTAASLYITTPTLEQGLLYEVTGNVEFSTDGLGNYTATDYSAPPILYPTVGFVAFGETVMQDQSYATKDGFLYLTYLTYLNLLDPPEWTPATQVYKAIFNSATQFSLEHSNSLSNNGGPIICDRTDIPPNIPELTDNNILGSDVVLQWIDKSDDETGFVILRRDRLEGQWQEIANVGAGSGVGTTQSYTDTGLSAGTYWYRVKAVNANGKSFGSNLTKITIE